MWVPPKATTGRTPAEVSQGTIKHHCATRTHKVKWGRGTSGSRSRGRGSRRAPRLSRGLVRNEVAQILQCAGEYVVTMMIGVQETT